jgi:uncharacterized SAM-dependent methyltransferase
VSVIPQSSSKAFEEDVIATVKGDQSGLLIKYLYSSFDEIMCDQDYYIPGEEEQLLNKCVSDIARLIGENRDIVELGCGTPLAIRHKILPLLKAFNAASFTANDFWEHNASASGTEVKSALPDLPVKSLAYDFMNASLSPSLPEHPVICLLGSTISNLVADPHQEEPEHVLSGSLKRLKEMGGGHASYIIVYDSFADGDVLERTYNTSEHEKFRLGIVSALEPYAGEKSLEKSDFESTSHWSLSKRMLTHTLTPLKDIILEFPSEPITLKADRSYVLGKSYKYSQETFTNVADKCGFQTRAIFTQSNSPMVVQVLEI